MQLHQLENVYLQHQPKVIITYQFYLGESSSIGETFIISNNLCKMIKDHPRMKEVRLLWLRPPITIQWTSPEELCHPDNILQIPILGKEAKHKIEQLINKTHL
jgi:hypothetical protein